MKQKATANAKNTEDEFDAVKSDPFFAYFKVVVVAIKKNLLN